MNLETASFVKIDTLILIPTCPRNGSSATAGIFDGLGAFSGNTVGVTLANEKGQFENQSIHSMFQKEISVRGLAGNRETYLALAKSGGMPKINNLRAKLSFILEDQGYEGGPAFFKHANFMFHFREIERQFPDCIWVIPERDDEYVALSMGALGMFSTRKEALKVIAIYRKCLELIKKECTNVYVIDTDKMIKEKDYSVIRPAIEASGLVWSDEFIEDWIDPSMFKTDRTWEEIEKTKPWLNRRRRRNGRRRMQDVAPEQLKVNKKGSRNED